MNIIKPPTEVWQDIYEHYHIFNIHMPAALVSLDFMYDQIFRHDTQPAIHVDSPPRPTSPAQPRPGTCDQPATSQAQPRPGTSR